MAAYNPYGSSSQPLSSFISNPSADMASFDSRAHSFAGHNPHAHHAGMTASTHSHHMSQTSVGSFRSSGEPNGHVQHPHQQPPLANPQIYTAVYSNVGVYEMEVNGVAVMRRRSDSWLNATQILKVAGVDKGRRTKILEKEILVGHHEKIQGGYGRYQGTWISYDRGRAFCRQYGVEDILRPLLDYDIASDGGQASNKLDTPTKEQAMAANRKRFYNSSVDNRSNGQAGTFFSNISPTASSALAAMNKISRFDSPMPRPGSAQRRPSSLLRRTSSQQQNSQEFAASQQSMQSFASDRDMDNAFADAAYSAQRQQDDTEPPRKRMKQSASQDPYVQIPLDASLYEETPTEPADSFSMIDANLDMDGIHPLPPLQPPRNESQERKQTILMSLFNDSSRSDYTSHPPKLQLSGSDLDMPLDTSGNTALHWAATLARVELVRLLIKQGANMMHGNVAGQTPLISAVLVNNTFDRGKFSELLECLGPLIELRDTTGRTLLHHIAVSSGIQGRAQSSKYYLDSLLEFIAFRPGSNPSSQQSFTAKGAQKKRLTISRFMAEVVNVQDKSGNTALNLAARIGNRAIIDQLEEIGADFYLANNTNFRPVDFGVVPKQQAASPGQPTQSVDSSQSKPPSEIDKIREEILATMSAVLNQTSQNYGTELAKKQAQIDTTTSTLKTVAQQHKEELARYEALQTRSQERLDRQQKIANLRRAIVESRHSLAEKNLNINVKTEDIGASDRIDLARLPDDEISTFSETYDSTNLLPDQASYLSSLPSTAKLQAHVDAYNDQITSLQRNLEQLTKRSTHHEQQYRKIIALCTGVPERSVEAKLEELVTAVESDGVGGVGLNGVGSNGSAGRVLPADRDMDVSKVRDFLRRVEAVES
ncbi:hypothetical protein FH972_021369 [Carpinus fangiana]|uniref:HTH APSES-type domain-containing protein n=1 Tax=Carpinus fangiana TaxID=176857 RepID=A0A5N6KPR9_9ROSI|nr:hypothetical protein FH972_021369 [Carpinus fangiana]